MTTIIKFRITGIARPVESRRDGVRVYVYTDGEPSCVHMDAPKRGILRRRMRERGATDDMLREAGLIE